MGGCKVEITICKFAVHERNETIRECKNAALGGKIAVLMCKTAARKWKAAI